MSATKKRILFIASEISPYLEETDFASIMNQLAIKANDNGFEVRCIMPRFGIINERRHRLHEVVRLSGINVSIENDDYLSTFEKSQLEYDGEITIKEPEIEYSEICYG